MTGRASEAGDRVRQVRLSSRGAATIGIAPISYLATYRP